jgi:pyruvate kinase
LNTKLLATLGPASLNEQAVRECTELGIHLFRINLSHTPIENIGGIIEKIRQWTDVPICLDSEGAQLRNQSMKGGSVMFVDGDRIRIAFSPIVGDDNNISFTPPGVVRQLEVGDEIRIDFGGATIKIIEKHHDHSLAVVIRGGRVGSDKAADTDRPLDFPPITEKDAAAIGIGKKLGIEHFALSFANSADDVRQLRALCGSNATIISKIESRPGLESLLDILDVTDQILIDRGDLSRQVPLEKIPFLQRRIIATAKSKGRQVFVATNLLESMITEHAPTRAEVNDVVSTLLMGADGLVLAAETAIGQYPVDAVRMIRTLADEVDKWTPYSNIDEILGS